MDDERDVGPPPRFRNLEVTAWIDKQVVRAAKAAGVRRVRAELREEIASILGQALEAFLSAKGFGGEARVVHLSMKTEARGRFTAREKAVRGLQSLRLILVSAEDGAWRVEPGPALSEAVRRNGWRWLDATCGPEAGVVQFVRALATPLPRAMESHLDAAERAERAQRRRFFNGFVSTSSGGSVGRKQEESAARDITQPEKNPRSNSWRKHRALKAEREAEAYCDRVKEWRYLRPEDVKVILDSLWRPLRQPLDRDEIRKWANLSEAEALARRAAIYEMFAQLVALHDARSNDPEKDDQEKYAAEVRRIIAAYRELAERRGWPRAADWERVDRQMTLLERAGFDREAGPEEWEKLKRGVERRRDEMRRAVLKWQKRANKANAKTTQKPLGRKAIYTPGRDENPYKRERLGGISQD